MRKEDVQSLAELLQDVSHPSSLVHVDAKFALDLLRQEGEKVEQAARIVKQACRAFSEGVSWRD